MITGEGTIDAAVEAMKGGAIDFVEKPYELEALRRTLHMVQEERSARALLGAVGSDTKISDIVSEAAARAALLAVLGPRAKPPSGAALVLRIAQEGRPPHVLAPAQLYHLNTAIEGYLNGVERPVAYADDLDLLEAFVPSPEAPIGRTIDEGRRRTVRGDRRRSASLARRPRALRPQGAFIADIEIVKD